MRRLTIRLIVLGVVLGGSWLSYQLADVTSCEGPRSDAWAEASFDRGEAAVADWETIDQYTTAKDFASLSARSYARYAAQLEQETPSCLDELQSIMESFLYNDWKSYEAASQGDFQLAAEHEDQANQALREMEYEFDRLAAKYDWDLEG